MNSFLSGLMNSMSKVAPTAATTQSPSILMQAFGAYMRGEDASTFMKNLAQTHPQLKPLNLDNLQATAQQVCQQNGVDMQSAINQIDNITSSITSQSP